MGVTCRFCRSPLKTSFADLGLSPISNAFVSAENLDKPEYFYPLHARVCSECFLVQVDDVVLPDQHFHADYAYFSSFSESWLKHCKAYVDQITEYEKLNGNSHVIELASNDGYLLQHFVTKGIPCLGIEPSANVAESAAKKGVKTWVRFFGENTAHDIVKEDKQADLIIANNVMAHVPDINDFVRGISIALKDDGLVTVEFPHLLRLMTLNQFDTIYHEHYSYLSALTMEQVFKRHGLNLYHCEELQTHGGSLRLYARKGSSAKTSQLERVLSKERENGLDQVERYKEFSRRPLEVKIRLWQFLSDAYKQGKKVGAYGAAAKGNTLLNYCGVNKELVPWVADLNPVKQGKYLPGTRIPVVSPDQIHAERPDYILILPWNIKSEVSQQLSFIRSWGGQFVVAIPEITVF